MIKKGNLYLIFNWETLGLPRWLSGKESACQCRRCRRHGFDPCWEDLLEEGMASHSSILAWEIPRTEEPGRLQSMRWGRKELDTTEHACEKGDSESSKKKILGKQRRIIIFSPGEKYKGKELKCRMKN